MPGAGSGEGMESIYIYRRHILKFASDDGS